MEKPKSAEIVVWFVVGAFLGVAIYGAVKGRFNAAFIAIPVVFLILLIAARRKRSQVPSQRAPNEKL
jgi:hypothetical protein